MKTKSRRLPGLRSILLIFVSIFVIICLITNTSAAKNKKEIEKRVGFLHGNCLAIKNKNLLKGSELIIVTLDDPQEIIHAKTGEMIEKNKECYALSQDRESVNRNSGYYFYSISSDKPVNLSIAVIQRTTVSGTSKKVVLDLNKDGKKDRFTKCASSEGIHFQIWSSVPNKSDLLWSGYYYLGYDIEPDCP